MPTRNCISCFEKRKERASSTEYEEILATNWGLYFVPIVNIGFWANKGVKHIIYPDGYIYHVYINGNHEKWSKHSKDSYNRKKCDECSRFESDYYELESRE